MKILIAEDHPAIQRLLHFRLERQGHEVTTTGNGEEALAALHRAEYALAILDITMPGLDGLSVLKRIRSTPALQDLPIIMLTASALEDHRRAGEAFGADAFLQKPVSSDELNAVVADLTSGDHAQVAY